MKYLRSLGQYEGTSGFEVEYISRSKRMEDIMETRASGFGELKAVKHSARVGGWDIGREKMPNPVGSDESEWIKGFITSLSLQEYRSSRIDWDENFQCKE